MPEEGDTLYGVFFVDKVDREQYGLQSVFKVKEEAIDDAKLWAEESGEWSDHEYIVCKLGVLGDED